MQVVLRVLSQLLTLIACLLVSTMSGAADAASDPTKLIIRNDSPTAATISWIHPHTGDRSYILTLRVDMENYLNSFVGHNFEVLEQNEQCEKEGNCLARTLTASQAHNQAFIVDDDFKVVEVGNLEKVPRRTDVIWEPTELLPKCQERAKRALLATARTDDEKSHVIMEDFHACLQNGLAPKLRQGKEEVHFEADLRATVANGMENFTCIDPELGTSPDVETREWISDKDQQPRVVHVKLNRPGSRIHVIENFAFHEECDAMAAIAEPKLGRASTADGKGGTQYTENRKALQAGIRPKWEKEGEGDLVTRLSRRVYDYANYELDMNIEEHGQEPLMSIQYFGRGYNDTEPDRYMPHCDGTCDGTPHPYGTRVATMVIYCTIPERGGHTNFQNANVHVKPEVGSAIFFSYIDPVTNLTDNLLTQHSGCPVYEGEKKIITQWIRYGVSKSVQHHAFNTLGILRSEDGE